nr:hypothetical protein [Spelaeibacter cavernicola]
MKFTIPVISTSEPRLLDAANAERQLFRRRVEVSDPTLDSIQPKRLETEANQGKNGAPRHALSSFSRDSDSRLCRSVQLISVS